MAQGGGQGIWRKDIAGDTIAKGPTQRSQVLRAAKQGGLAAHRPQHRATGADRQHLQRRPAQMRQHQPGPGPAAVRTTAQAALQLALHLGDETMAGPAIAAQFGAFDQQAAQDFGVALGAGGDIGDDGDRRRDDGRGGQGRGHFVGGGLHQRAVEGRRDVQGNGAGAQFLGLFDGSVDGGLGQLLIGLAFVFGSLLYSTLFEGLWNGQSLGKKAMSLRVRMLDGTPVTFAAALYRNLFRVVDAMPGIPVIGLYMVGLVLMFTSERSQRLGDLAAGTVVVYEPRSIPRFNPSPYKFGQHPFEHAIGELRGMTIEEYFAIKRLCDRFPELGPETQARSLREFWDPFARRHGIAPIANVHPVYLMEAVVMRFGRQKGLL